MELGFSQVIKKLQTICLKTKIYLLFGKLNLIDCYIYKLIWNYPLFAYYHNNLILPTFFMRLINKTCFSFTQYPKNLDLSHSNTFYYKDLVKKISPSRQKPVFDAKTLAFGALPSDHMVNIYFQDQKWQAPILQPFTNLPLHPFNSTFHYGVTCYEGLKAYKNEKGEVRLFRPECNMARFKKSSKRASLPDFDGRELQKVLEQYVRIQQQYIPPYKGYSLYLRPFHFSMESSLGVKSPSKSQIMIVSSPVGPYYPTGFNPISLLCETHFIRSAPGGTGGYKLGGNYGPTIAVGNDAQKQGHQQVLWLWNGKVGEIGSSNIFFVLTDKNTNKRRVITPSLQDLVLPGITRDSIIQLLHHKGIQVEQRVIMIDEVTKLLKDGEISEIFASGTAVIVSPVKNVQYDGKQYPLKIHPEYKSGELTYEIFHQMLDIQEGRKPDPFGWVRKIEL